MPSYPAFLSRVLRLQIRDRNLVRWGVIAGGAFRPAGKFRGLSEVLAFRRLQVSARDFKSRRRRYDNPSAYREHTAVVRTPARGIGSAIAVARLCQTLLRWRFKQRATIFRCSSILKNFASD